MNAARIWKLVTAGFLAAGLLVAVPAESQAATQAPARSAAVAPAPNAAQTSLPKCGCPPNAPEVVYALKELGVKSLTLSLLEKRLGKTVGTDTFDALVLALTKKAAKVKKRVPFPDYQAKSATTYARSPYRVYEIYGTSKGPGFYHWTWKYGITRQLIPAQRPERQLPACTRYYGAKFLLNGKCTYDWVWIGVGWFQARTMEAVFTLLYTITHQGKCPPGMPACV